MANPWAVAAWWSTKHVRWSRVARVAAVALVVAAVVMAVAVVAKAVAATAVAVVTAAVVVMARADAKAVVTAVSAAPMAMARVVASATVIERRIGDPREQGTLIGPLIDKVRLKVQNVIGEFDTTKEQIDRLVDDDLVRRFAIAGTPAECADLASEALGLGFSAASFNLAAPLGGTLAEGLQVTLEGAAEVLAALRAGRAES